MSGAQNGEVIKFFTEFLWMIPIQVIIFTYLPMIETMELDWESVIFILVLVAFILLIIRNVMLNRRAMEYYSDMLNIIQKYRPSHYDILLYFHIILFSIVGGLIFTPVKACLVLIIIGVLSISFMMWEKRSILSLIATESKLDASKKKIVMSLFNTDNSCKRYKSMSSHWLLMDLMFCIFGFFFIVFIQYETIPFLADVRNQMLVLGIGLMVINIIDFYTQQDFYFWPSEYLKRSKIKIVEDGKDNGNN